MKFFVRVPNHISSSLLVAQQSFASSVRSSSPHVPFCCPSLEYVELLSVVVHGSSSSFPLESLSSVAPFTASLGSLAVLWPSASRPRSLRVPLSPANMWTNLRNALVDSSSRSAPDWHPHVSLLTFPAVKTYSLKHANISPSLPMTTNATWRVDEILVFVNDQLVKTLKIV